MAAPLIVEHEVMVTGVAGAVREVVAVYDERLMMIQLRKNVEIPSHVHDPDGADGWKGLKTVGRPIDLTWETIERVEARRQVLTRPELGCASAAIRFTGRGGGRRFSFTLS